MNPVLPDQEQDIVADLNALGPGDRLRNARLALDIDSAKIANRLHLTTDVVEALERDDYSEMTARVFVRGYLRNYAREVNLPVDSVLEQFDNIWPESERPVKLTTPPRLASDTHPGNRWMTLFTWLIVLSGIALFLIWWQGYLDDFLQQHSNNSATSGFSAPANTQNQAHNTTLPAFMQPVQPADESTTFTADANRSPSSSPDVGNTNLNPSIAQTTTATTPTTLTAESAQVAISQAGGTKPSTTSQPTDIVSTISPEGVRQITIDQSNPATAAQTPASEEVVMELRPVDRADRQPGQVANEQAAQPETQPPALNPNIVTVTFNGLCWVDIRDSTRNFKLVGQMNQGDSHQLGGEPPYSMVIGNAKAAQILVGGKPYDLTQHTIGNVARLTLRL